MNILCAIKTGINHKESRIPIVEKTWATHRPFIFF
jgi:hypothetical protein